ncbi:MAG: hypothetical protein FJ396_07405 [Verrucomicrobia bacterium]|nr:hypothetical protein [Verrucomicrobiota bacterium]
MSLLEHPAERARLAAFYSETLTRDVLPFWVRHGWDREHGGIFTCLDRNGSLMDSDKSVWFQGRAGWMFATAFRTVEARPEWLEVARSCAPFSRRHGHGPGGKMWFLADLEGRSLRMLRAPARALDRSTSAEAGHHRVRRDLDVGPREGLLHALQERRLKTAGGRTQAPVVTMQQGAGGNPSERRLEIRDRLEGDHLASILSPQGDPGRRLILVARIHDQETMVGAQRDGHLAEPVVHLAQHHGHRRGRNIRSRRFRSWKHAGRRRRGGGSGGIAGGGLPCGGRLRGGRGT